MSNMILTELLVTAGICLLEHDRSRQDAAYQATWKAYDRRGMAYIGTTEKLCKLIFSNPKTTFKRK